MKKILLLFSLLVNFLSINAQNNTFYRKYNLPGMQGALQIAATLDGGFAATGQHESSAQGSGHGECDIYVYRLDVCGNILWFKLYGTPSQEGGKSIIQTNDGGFLVSGLYEGSGTNRAFNMKIDANGNVQWLKKYTCEWMMYAEEISTGGYTCIGRNTNVLYLMKIDNLGNLLWSKALSNMGDMGLYLKNLSNGDILLTSIKANLGKDIVVGRFDGSGNAIWIKNYGGTGYPDADHTSWSCKAAVDEIAGTAVVTSPTLLGGLGGENILAAKVDINNGNVIWAKALGGANRDQSRDIVKYPNGYAILGHSDSYPVAANSQPGVTEAMAEKDILLFSLSDAGNLQWARTYGGNDRDKGVGVRFNLDNGFTMSAFTTSPFFGNLDSSMDPLFIKTDSVGIVACQMSSPPLSIVNIALTATNTGSVANGNITASVPAYGVINFTPSDSYLCQSCSTTPIFTPSDTMVCTGDSVFFTNTTTVGLTCFQEWEIENQNFSGSSNPGYVFNSPGDYNIYLYSTCGVLSDTLMLTIHVYEPVINAPPAMCIDQSTIQLSSNIPGGSWSGNGITNPIFGSFNPAIGAGSQIITYTIPQLCIVLDTIIINALPIIDAGPNISVCFSLDSMIGIPTNNAVSYAWNNANGLSAINVSNPTLNLTNLSNSTPLNVSYILTGTETLNGIGCDNSDTMMVVINPLPNIGAGPDISICQFDPITLNGTGGVSYTWNNGVVNNTPFNQNSNSVTYTVIGNNVFNCFNSDSMTVSMNLLPNVTAGSDTIICTGDQLVLSGSGAQNYTWNNGQTNNNPFIPPSGITNYVVTGTDGFGCFNLDTLVATVYNVPIPTFTYTIDCYSHTITFTNITQGSSNINPAAILSSNWDFGDNSANSNLTNPQHLYSSNGNYSVTLTTSSSEGGCNDSVTQVVNIPIIPSVTSTVVLGCDMRADFTGSVIPNNTPLNYINWDFGDGNSLTSTNLSTTYNYLNPGVFNTNFSFIDVNNCTYSFFLPIEIFNNELLDDQEIPNVITANGDNVNDEFLLDGVIDICLEYEIVILNRWGNKVFQTNQFGQVFKGDDLNGETLSEGVYFYIIRADSQERVGHITIIK